MLTGAPPFTGASVQAIVARIMTSDPESITRVRRTVAPALDAVVLQGLSKLPADRFESSRAFADALRDAQLLRDTRFATTVADLNAERRRMALLASVGALAAVGIAGALWGWLRPLDGSPLMRYTMEQPEGAPIAFMQLSAGGRLIFAPAASLDRPAGLFLKNPGDAAAHFIPGTDGAGQVAISPDEESIAFVVSSPDVQSIQKFGVLNRMAIGGGPVTNLATSAGIWTAGFATPPRRATNASARCRPW